MNAASFLLQEIKAISATERLQIQKGHSVDGERTTDTKNPRQSMYEIRWTAKERFPGSFKSTNKIRTAKQSATLKRIEEILEVGFFEGTFFSIVFMHSPMLHAWFTCFPITWNLFAKNIFQAQSGPRSCVRCLHFTTIQ